MRIRIFLLVLSLVLSGFSSAGAFDDPFVMVGNEKMKAGDYNSAIAMYNAAMDLNPADALPFINRAAAYAAKNKLDLALADLNMALTLDPYRSEAYSSRAAVAIMTSAYALAIADATTAIRLNEKNAEAYYNRAVAAYMMNDKKTVWADLFNARRLGYKPAMDMLEMYSRQQRQ